MQTLSKGANTALPPGPVSVRVTAAAPVDISALLVAETGKVRDDDGFVFYNQPSAPGVRYDPAGVDVDPAQVEAAVDKVVVTASLDGRGPATFGALGGLRMDVAVAGTPVAAFTPDGLGSETALLCVEIYRRGGAWKVRAVGQGYANGLGGIATDYGITVDDDPAPATAAAPPVPAAPSTINLDKGRVSLAKRQTVSLTKTGAPPLRRVAMGLGWDPARGGRSIDLDASAIVIGSTGRQVDAVWFMSKSAFRAPWPTPATTSPATATATTRRSPWTSPPSRPTRRRSCSSSTPSRARSSPRWLAPTAGCSTWRPGPSSSASTSPTPSPAPASS
jgi:stress response protein SCP2